jgi:hypothetical protein
MKRSDALLLLALLVLSRRTRAGGGARSPSGLPYGPWTEDNTIPSQPIIPDPPDTR